MQEIALLIELIRAILCQSDKLTYSKECDSTELMKMIRRQSLVSFCWPFIAKQDDDTWKLIAEQLENDYNKALHKALIQHIEIQSLLDDMEKREMDCLPLKGWIMKDYYSDPTLRSMTDFDVLLKQFDEKQLKTWMESLGYEADHLGDEHHDVYIKKPYTVVELHKSLSDEKVEKEIPQIDEWLENIWGQCALMDGKQHIYQLSKEDFYIYHLIHMYKHFRASGVGIRPLVDIYVFLKKEEKNLDWKYADQVLEELRLKQFEQTMKSLSKKCFSEKQIVLNEDDKTLINFLVGAGLFGDKRTETTLKVVTAKQESHIKRRISVALQTIFQPAKVLDSRYPILKRYPVMLPFIWIIRLFRVVFKEHYKITLLKEASEKEEYYKMREIFKIAGIEK